MIVEYDENGLITHVIGTYGPKLEELLRDRGRTFVKLTEPPKFNLLAEGFVEAGEVKKRQPLPVKVSKSEIKADDKDEAVISGIPDPCEVWVDGQKVVVTGGRLQVSSPMAATYIIVIEKWPYLPYRQAITAVPK